MGRLFGTDGVRGLANGDLTADLALGLAQAAAVRPHARAARRRACARRASARRAVVARDPGSRASSLTAAVAAGLASLGHRRARRGRDPDAGGRLPGGRHGADFGVMISASHNPAPDNGIKFFAFGGTKLPDEVEDRIEARARRAAPSSLRPVAASGASAASRTPRTATSCTCSSTLDVAPRRAARRDRLRPRRGRGISPQVFTDAGAKVTVIGADPDGLNINDGVGSTHLDPLQRAVVETAPTSASPTTATPTAASRWMHRAASSTATRSWRSSRSRCKQRGMLANDTLVATVMSNLGLQARDGRARHRRSSRPPSATATCSRPSPSTRCRWAASSRATSSSATTRRRATAS